MADPDARDLVRGLLNQGLSASAISRAIGRDPKGGGISQIARDVRGPGYGRAFVDSLQALSRQVGTASGEAARSVAGSIAASSPISPPRRRTQHGRQARVRMSSAADHQAGPTAWSIRGGRLVSWDRYEVGRGAKTQAATLRRRLQKSPRGQNVRVKLHGIRPDGAPGALVLPDMLAGNLIDMIVKGAPDDPVLAIDPADPPNRPRRRRRKRTTLDVLMSVMDRAQILGLPRATTGSPDTLLSQVTGFEAWAVEFDEDDEEEDDDLDDEDDQEEDDNDDFLDPRRRNTW